MVAVLACLLAFAPSASAQETTWVRKDVKDLTAQEKRDFVRAIYKLKRTRSPFGRRKISYYDFLVYYHRRASNDLENGNGAHMGPAFLPWHREFLNAFEALLTNIAGKHIAVPYWDWTNPASTQAMLSDDMMGGVGDPNDRYAVKTGPFRKGRWELKLRARLRADAGGRGERQGPAAGRPARQPQALRAVPGAAGGGPGSGPDRLISAARSTGTCAARP